VVKVGKTRELPALKPQAKRGFALNAC